MPGRRAFLQHVFGGVGVAAVHLTEAASPRALVHQDSYCPQCGCTFGVQYVEDPRPRVTHDMYVEMRSDAPSAVRCRPYAVRCGCGWRGSVTFWKET